MNTRAALDRHAVCAHCGLDVPRGFLREHDEEQFCCAGCRQVYTLVRAWGLDHYYRLVSRETDPREPARVSGRTFEDFDAEPVQADASEALGPERRRTRLYLEGVHCSACVWLVEKLPAVLTGVDDLRLNVGSAVAVVTWRPSRTRLSTIARALDRLGYTPHVHRAARTQEARRAEDRAGLARLGVAAACAMNLMFLNGAIYAGEYSGMAAPYAVLFRWLSFAVSLPVILYAARPFFQTALGGLRARIVHIDLPIAIALATGYAASAVNIVRGAGPLWFDSLAMLTAALLGARQLQRGAQRAALERADSLRGVAFLEFARRLGTGPDAPVVEVPLQALAPGDQVEVLSGELIPADGVILSGSSTVNNAVLTGEAAPQLVREGDAVCAGATNTGARLVVRVDATGAKTRVGALLAIVEDALSRKPALLQATDRLARRFVWAVLALSVITAIAWWGFGPEVALQRVVALLVVSCPCALGLSVPLAVSVALMRAARAGIFVKDPDALERMRRVGTVVLDKTGTLTEGRTRVVCWHGDERTLDLVCALEAESSHGIARAFHAMRPSVRAVRSVAEVVETAGQGIAGRVDGQAVRAGNRAHVTVDDRPIPASIAQHADAMVAEGISPVFVAIDGVVCGLAGVGDAVRPDAAATVAALRRRGIAVRILSGDEPGIVARVGAQLGLDPAHALGGLTPEHKRDLVAALMADPARCGAIVMAGDGVNDAAALAIADAGVAVHGGTGATIAAADVVLTREGVGPILEILDGADRLRRVVARNVAFSLVYNAVASSLAIAGLVGPLLAVVLMPLSSLIVVLSSALTRTFARP